MTGNSEQIGIDAAMAAPGTPAKVPDMRSVTFADIRASLATGWSDFLAHPLYGLFFGGIFAAGGLLMFALLTRIGAPWMIIPLAIGFPLVAPFVAVGLYEISRRRQAGEPVTRAGVLAHVFHQRERQLGWMAFVVLFIFWIWVYQVRLLLALFLGFKSFSSWDAFAHILVSTPEGAGFLIVGSIVGAGLALVLFSTTVIAMPLLMVRDIDFVSAMIASVGVVTRSPVPMVAFGVLIGGMTLVSLMPAFLGLLMVLPVLGHATWHLYSRISGVSGAQPQ